MIIGTCSYLPLDPELRKFRLERIKLQKEFFDKELPGIKIYTCAQQYKEEDYLPGIEYIKFETGIGQSKARNELLKVFYNSDEDFMLMADDDTFLYPYYDCMDYFRDAIIKPKPFLQLDLVAGLLPILGGFKSRILDNLEAYENNHILIPLQSKTLAFCLYKNTKKYYNKEYYLSDVKFKGFHEDIDFFIKLLLDGRTIRTNPTFILNTPSNEGTSTLFKGFNDRVSGLVETRECLIKTYGKTNLRFLSTGGLDYSKLRKEHDPAPENIFIQRTKKMVLIDRLKTVHTRSNQKPIKKGLF